MVAHLVSGKSVWQRRHVLRVAGARLLDDRDRGGVRAALDEDPVAACMVAARVEVAGLDPWRLGGELWSAGSHLSGLCFSGANLVPIRGDRAALRQFADRARRGGRSCSSIVGRAELVLPMWDTLAVHWAPCREVRADQSSPPSRHGSSPATSTRAATMQAATGSSSSAARTPPRSRSSRSRAPATRSTCLRCHIDFLLTRSATGTAPMFALRAPLSRPSPVAHPRTPCLRRASWLPRSGSRRSRARAPS